MIILGIETSCDETAVAVLEVTANGNVRVLSNVVSSQVKLHAKYGGVVPALAAREHVKNIGHVFQKALSDAGILPAYNLKTKSYNLPINLIAVTRGPGLGPSLLVGLTFARTLAWQTKIPIVGTNHLCGHIYSNWLKPIAELKIKSSKFKVEETLKLPTADSFPSLCVVVSGGHTELVLANDLEKFNVIGTTLDDAIGEAFDKVARLLGLGYPGGPAIAKKADEWTADSEQRTAGIEFPRPMLNSKDFNFSYSGLKTAVLYKVRDLEKANGKLSDSVIAEIAYAFQDAATDVIVQKTKKAADKYGVKSIMLSGGVSANKTLRERLAHLSEELAVPFHCPEMVYTGDNASMIALAGYFAYKKSPKKKWGWKTVLMDANLGF